jgi:hypothetical protein
VEVDEEAGVARVVDGLVEEPEGGA